jgi:hypothetical protein
VREVAAVVDEDGAEVEEGGRHRGRRKGSVERSTEGRDYTAAGAGRAVPGRRVGMRVS